MKCISGKCMAQNTSFTPIYRMCTHAEAGHKSPPFHVICKANATVFVADLKVFVSARWSTGFLMSFCIADRVFLMLYKLVGILLFVWLLAMILRHPKEALAFHFLLARGLDERSINQFLLLKREEKCISTH